MEREDGSSSRKIWSAAMHEYFVDLCIQEALNGNKPGTSFTREGWRNVLESLNRKPEFQITRKQLKNRWDLTRGKWKAWCKLIGTSSMKWDPNTRQFGASQQDWANYIKFNPEAAVFRHKELELADKLELVFPGITPATETEVTEPAAQRRKLDDSPTTSALCAEEKDTGESQRLQSESDEGHDTEELKPTGVQPKRIEHRFEAIELTPIDMQPKRIEHLYEAVELRPRDLQPKRIEHLYEPVQLSPIVSQPKVIERRCDAIESRPINTQPEKVEQRQCDAVESRSTVTIQSTQGERSYTIGECIECLDAMEEVEQGGNLYLFALDVFLRKEYREIFLQLKKPAIKIAWLERLQRVAIFR